MKDNPWGNLYRTSASVGRRLPHLGHLGSRCYKDMRSIAKHRLAAKVVPGKIPGMLRFAPGHSCWCFSPACSPDSLEERQNEVPQRPKVQEVSARLGEFWCFMPHVLDKHALWRVVIVQNIWPPLRRSQPPRRRTVGGVRALSFGASHQNGRPKEICRRSAGIPVPTHRHSLPESVRSQPSRPADSRHHLRQYMEDIARLRRALGSHQVVGRF